MFLGSKAWYGFLVRRRWQGKARCASRYIDRAGRRALIEGGRTRQSEQRGQRQARSTRTLPRSGSRFADRGIFSAVARGFESAAPVPLDARDSEGCERALNVAHALPTMLARQVRNSSVQLRRDTECRRFWYFCQIRFHSTIAGDDGLLATR